uniref:(northern house mosquito) hypothetical protein n=1 Tax=Culex pipiens TaxID=7175 RepID=A0A8D8D1Y5_CULPI
MAQLAVEASNEREECVVQIFHQHQPDIVQILRNVGDVLALLLTLVHHVQIVHKARLLFLGRRSSDLIPLNVHNRRADATHFLTLDLTQRAGAVDDAEAAVLRRLSRCQPVPGRDRGTMHARYRLLGFLLRETALQVCGNVVGLCKRSGKL